MITLSKQRLSGQTIIFSCKKKEEKKEEEIPWRELSPQRSY